MNGKVVRECVRLQRLIMRKLKWAVVILSPIFLISFCVLARNKICDFVGC